VLGQICAKTQYRQDFQRTYIYNIKTLVFFCITLKESRFNEMIIGFSLV